MSRWPRAHVAVAVAATLGLIAIATSTRQRIRGAAHRASYVTVRGASLRYVRAGHGPSIVLLHGFGESLVAWRGVFDQLTNEYDVTALDLPGFGLSTKRPAGYQTDSLAADVLEVIRALGIRRPVLVGHSLGGAVAAAVAATAPRDVRALILVAPALIGAPLGMPDSTQDRTDDAVRRAIVEYEALRTRFTAPHDPLWLAESDSALAYLPATDTAYTTALAATLREFDFGWLTDERAHRLQMPTLVLWGEFDTVLPFAEGRALAARLPQARFEPVSRSWHRPHVEQPVEAATMMRRFLAELPRD